MFSVQQIPFKDIVKNQFIFKLKAYNHVIVSLYIFQIIGLFLSFSEEMTGFSTNYMSITTKILSGNIIISFTWLWTFVVAFYVANRASKNMMFTFVYNKLSNHLANFFLMLYISAIGAISSVLLTVALRLGVLFYYGDAYMPLYEHLTVGQLILAIFVTFLYSVLIFSFGYFIAEAIQLHKTFIFFVPLVLFALFVLSVNLWGEAYIFTFFFMESNVLLFTFKVFRSTLLLWFVAIFIGKRMEVREG